MSPDRLPWFDEVVSGGQARNDCVRDLREYFAETGGIPAYSGSRFESFGANPRDHVTVDDLIAVSMLSVHVPGQAGLRLLERAGSAITELLAKIPTDLDLHDQAAASHIASGSPADELWTLLRSSRRRGDSVGIGRVTTSKLLARKRPRLLPVWDSIVGTQLGLDGPEEHWDALHAWLRADWRRVETLRSLRDDASVPSHVNVLRVLDVVLWMRGKDDRSARDQQTPFSA